MNRVVAKYLNKWDIIGGAYPFTNTAVGMTMSNDPPEALITETDPDKLKYELNTGHKMILYTPFLRSSNDRQYTMKPRSFKIVAHMENGSGTQLDYIIGSNSAHRLKDEDGHHPLMVINAPQATINESLTLPTP